MKIICIFALDFQKHASVREAFFTHFSNLSQFQDCNDVYVYKRRIRINGSTRVDGYRKRIGH